MSTKRQDLLDAAEVLFSEGGYGATQISEIAKVAGTGISTFYRYFDTKEALLAELLAELFGPLISDLRQYRAGMETQPPLAQLRRIRGTYELVLDALVQRPKLTLVLFSSGFGASAAVSERVQEALDAISEDLVADLTRGEAVGNIVVSDKWAFARGIISVLMHLAHDHVRTQSPSREAAIDVCTRMTVGALFTYANTATRLAFAPFLHMVLSSQGDEE